jgi:transcriptional regulator with XRE-family HTH domain
VPPTTRYPPGYTLRQLRADRGLTQRAVSVLSGLTQQEVALLERGRRHAQPVTIVKLAKALGIGADRMQAILTASRDGDAA